MATVGTDALDGNLTKPLQAPALPEVAPTRCVLGTREIRREAEYTILSSGTIHGLAVDVNALAHNDFTPAGGIVVYDHVFYQAMFRALQSWYEVHSMTPEQRVMAATSSE